jgi:hypothetical protein
MFSVDEQRVTLDGRLGWLCTCTGNAVGLQCAHVQQAQGFRSMRGLKRDDDTLELQFTATDLIAVSKDVPEAPSGLHRAEDALRPKRVLHVSRVAAFVFAAAVAGVSSGITYLAATRPQPIRVAENDISVPLVAPTPEPANQSEAPVQFVNPFDGTEVFEFPPGTSESGAREAVAELLLKRAHERMATVAEMERGRGNAVDRSRPGGGSELGSAQVIHRQRDAVL